jgi:molybdate-binding protein/DNA-binding XRE family transcriptional regulator
VSRQTIYAIEAGSFVPNTEVSLRLARELGVAVEALFALEGEPVEERVVEADVLRDGDAEFGVRLAMVGEKWAAVPVGGGPYFLPDADGELVGGGVRCLGEVGGGKQLVLAGCDPAIGIVARMVEQVVERARGVEIVPAAASSGLALRWLREGRVHVAGCHLRDAATGEFNLPFLSEEDFVVVTFAHWEQGLVVARGNPLGIRGVGDLAGLRMWNREEGAGARQLLEERMREAGMRANDVVGLGRVARGHLAVAYQVAQGAADACVATRASARAFGLEFVALQRERYDLVMRRSLMQQKGAAEGLLDVLQRAVLRRKLEGLAGYDTRETGRVVG